MDREELIFFIREAITEISNLDDVQNVVCQRLIDLLRKLEAAQ